VTLDMPSSFHTIYSPSKALPFKTEELITAATRLSTLFVTMNELPSIRYARSSNHALTVATKLNEALERARRELGATWQPNSENQATILILERASDSLAPLMHEYTLQAMAMDLLGLKGDRYKCVGRKLFLDANVLLTC
jgi:hypothetical protein